VKKGPPGPTDTQHKQQRRSLLSYALFRWESAAILALILILAIFVPDPFRGLLTVWRWWFWLILGGLAETLIVVTTFQDPDLRARLASERMRDRLAPNTIANVEYRQIADRALRQYTEVEQMHQRTHRKAQREQLRPVVDDMARWASRIVRFAQHLDDRLLQTSAQAPDSAPLTADARLQDSLGALEAAYARLQLIVAQGLNERRIKQLRGEIAQQTRDLQETMESMS
jgi:hypothetical protein